MFHVFFNRSVYSKKCEKFISPECFDFDIVFNEQLVKLKVKIFQKQVINLWNF